MNADLRINRLVFARNGAEIDSFCTTTGARPFRGHLTEKEQEMISSLLSCLLPLVSGVDADFSVNVQVAPGISVNLHSPSYYDQREKDRQARLEQIQAEREEERNRMSSFERSKPRDQGGMYQWRDTRASREMARQRLLKEQREHEEARIAQERLLREEEEQDRLDRRLAVEHEREERMRAEAREEEDRRHQEDVQERRDGKPSRTIHDDDHDDQRSIHD